MANPTEVYPSTATIDGLDGTTDGSTGLAYVAKGTTPSSSPTLAQQFDRTLNRLYSIVGATSECRVVKVDDNTIGIFVGYYSLAGADYYYPGEASIAVSSTDDTYYVYLDADSDTGGSGTSNVVTDATGWPGDPGSYIPLAEITVSGNVITAIADVRNRCRLSSRPFMQGRTTVAGDVLVIPVTARLVEKTTAGDAEALTLADGTPGQQLTIVLVTDGGGDGTLTPDTSTGWATIVFADAGDAATLEYVDDTYGWIITGLSGKAGPPAHT